MNVMSRRWLRITVLLVITILLGVFAIWHFQTYRINKISFIIWDNQHDNLANLTKEQFADYLQHCGALVDNSESFWGVRYDGFLQHRVWVFRYIDPQQRRHND
jgi:hypothetical protein